MARRANEMSADETFRSRTFGAIACFGAVQPVNTTKQMKTKASCVEPPNSQRPGTTGRVDYNHRAMAGIGAAYSRYLRMANMATLLDTTSNGPNHRNRGLNATL